MPDRAELTHSGLTFLQALLAVPGIGALLDGLAAYTQRHAARLDRLRRSVALLDYTLGSMHVVSPAADGEVTGRALPAAAAAVLPALNGAAGPARQPEGAPGPGVTGEAILYMIYLRDFWMVFGAHCSGHEQSGLTFGFCWGECLVESQYHRWLFSAA